MFGDESTEGVALSFRSFPWFIGNAQNAVDVDECGFGFNDERAFVQPGISDFFCIEFVRDLADNFFHDVL